MIIEKLAPFKGQHCETTATGTLLKHIGVDLSEPMLFGLGEGLNFIVWNMKTMPLPFIGGRIKPDALTANIARNLNLELKVNETSSVSKAWTDVKSTLDQSVPVGLKLDCYHLDYFTNKIHFAGHYAAMYGYDHDFAYLVDTAQQGSQVKTRLKNLELARNEKGPMSSRNLWYTISKGSAPADLSVAVKQALKNNAAEYLNPPIQNISYKGILKMPAELEKWFNASKNKKADFQLMAVLMERAGTGGAIFRNLYRDFLKESNAILSSPKIASAFNSFKDAAALWKEVSGLIEKAGAENNPVHLKTASQLLKQISTLEKTAMEQIVTLE
jgi:hypothetical protein